MFCALAVKRATAGHRFSESLLQPNIMQCILGMAGGALSTDGDATGPIPAAAAVSAAAATAAVAVPVSEAAWFGSLSAEERRALQSSFPLGRFLDSRFFQQRQQAQQQQ